ncbi:hypothetical protein GJ496_002579 [Pomphorhynchus laevis]|nr:hypothetical protein GJ496_002579 [Pomphorhynchus laevis]
MNMNSSREWVEKRRRAKITDTSDLSSWKAHTFTALLAIGVTLCYVASYNRHQPTSAYQNIQRGLIGCLVFFVGFCTVHLPNGPFIRPHPAFWRFILSITVVYEIGLIFLLFQNNDDVRHFLKYIDSNLGVPLTEKDYGGNCLIYDSNYSSDPWHNVRDKLDVFVIAHLLGWFVRALAFRDIVMCLICSAGFEFIEYTLQEQLPNFTECWWDHWILDFTICNGLGLYAGIITCDYLIMKQREWKRVGEIPGLWSKFVRIVLQFTPHDWLDFEWKPLSSLRRWLMYICIIIGTIVIETGTFYVKTTLWIPPEHVLCILRVSLCTISGVVSIRELFELIDNPKCTRLGTQTWVLMSILFTEGLIVFKFGREIIEKPIPRYMSYFWLATLTALTAFTICYFIIYPYLFAVDKTKKKRSKKNNSR